MMIPHLLVAGVLEAAITAGVVAYLQRAEEPLLELYQPRRKEV
jgi:ABC-type Co2+ transport system permease subunit